MTKKRNISSRAKSFFKTMIILALVLTLIIVVDIRIRPMIRSMAESQARSIATLAINEAVSEVMSEENVGYDDLISIEKDENGRVTAVKTNIVRMNSLKSKITTRISEKIDKVKKKEIYLPLGSVLGGDLLSGRGPSIKLYLTLSGSATTTISNKFDSAGINQTRHQVMLNVVSSIYVIVPGCSTSTKVETNICIAETVIVGLVPDTYAEVGISPDAGVTKSSITQK